MKRATMLALASGLALAVAGCSTSSSTPPSSAEAAATGAGQSSFSKSIEPVRFDLAVRCPGVHYLLAKGKSKTDVESQLNVTDDQVADCEKYVASQPKGYVPPPPPGYVPPPAKTAQAGGEVKTESQTKAGAQTDQKSSTTSDATKKN